MSLFHLVKELSLTIEEVDSLSGPIIGRPKSATFRTCDLVGLDTLIHVANGVYENCPDDEMRSKFYNGVYDIHLIGRFGSKVERELERYLDHNFFPRCGAGIGVSRLMSCYN